MTKKRFQKHHRLGFHHQREWHKGGVERNAFRQLCARVFVITSHESFGARVISNSAFYPPILPSFHPNNGACMTGIILLINIISCGDGGIRMPKAERISLPLPLAQCFSRRQKVLFSGRNEECWLVAATGNAKAAISRGRFCGASHNKYWACWVILRTDLVRGNLSPTRDCIGPLEASSFRAN